MVIATVALVAVLAPKCKAYCVSLNVSGCVYVSGEGGGVGVGK